MTDVVRADSDLSKYKMVVAPMMYMLTEKQADNIKAYVKMEAALSLHISVASQTIRIMSG